MQKVTLYSQPGWMFCAKVKEFPSQNKIEYTDRNIAADESALADLEKLGHMTTPVTVVDGEVVIGFDRAKLEKLLLGWNVCCFYLWESFDQRRHRVFRQMIQEFVPSCWCVSCRSIPNLAPVID
jgi:glutaredoxin